MLKKKIFIALLLIFPLLPGQNSAQLPKTDRLASLRQPGGLPEKDFGFADKAPRALALKANQQPIDWPPSIGNDSNGMFSAISKGNLPSILAISLGSTSHAA